MRVGLPRLLRPRFGIQCTDLETLLVVNKSSIFLLFPLSSGYDFAYLLKVLTAINLPSDETEFFELLRIYFPRIYDVKYLMKSCKDLKGGLQEVADILQVRMIETVFVAPK